MAIKKTADQLARETSKKSTTTTSTSTPRIPAGTAIPKVSAARTPAQEAAYQKLLAQQRAENQSRMAGTTRQAEIVTGKRPIDVGATAAERAAKVVTKNTPSVSSGRSSTQPSAASPYVSSPVAAASGGVSNVAELRAMYAKALAELQRQQGVAGQTIAESIARMQADPMNTANAYAQLQAIAPTVAANPVADYAAAAGLAPGVAQEAQRLATAEADAYRAAVENLNQTMRASQEAANQSRMADIGLIETGAKQDLANQANMLNLLLKQAEIGGVTNLQQKNLENEMSMRNALTSQISNIFSGQNVAPESILKLIEATMSKLNMSRWQ